jgi:hypothetical protein
MDSRHRHRHEMVGFEDLCIFAEELPAGLSASSME